MSAISARRVPLPPGSSVVRRTDLLRELRGHINIRHIAGRRVGCMIDSPESHPLYHFLQFFSLFVQPLSSRLSQHHSWLLFYVFVTWKLVYLTQSFMISINHC